MNKVKTIFVIEDSLILSEIIAIQLKHHFDCDVIIFKNGDNIFCSDKNYSPDLIILDYNLNDSKLDYQNGLEVLIELRKGSKVPVIVFSGQQDIGKAVEIVKKGANDYINKDDDDFMQILCSSIEDIFNLKYSKERIKKLNRDVKKGLIFLFLISLAVFSALNFFHN